MVVLAADHVLALPEGPSRGSTLHTLLALLLQLTLGQAVQGRQDSTRLQHLLIVHLDKKVINQGPL